MSSSSDYSKMTVVQLKELARSQGLRGYSTLRKAELIDLLSGTGATAPAVFVEEKKLVVPTSYDKMTVVQLKESARSQGLRGYSTLKKADLIALLSGSAVAVPVVVEEKVSVRSPKKLSPKSPRKASKVEPYLKTDTIPVLSSILASEGENDYLFDNRSKEVWGHGPFTIRLPVNDYSHRIFEELNFNDDKDYTIKDIITLIIFYYKKQLTEDNIKEYMRLDDQKDLEIYEELLDFIKEGEYVSLAETNGGHVFIESFDKLEDGVYQLNLGG